MAIQLQVINLQHINAFLQTFNMTNNDELLLEHSSAQQMKTFLNLQLKCSSAQLINEL